MRANTSLLSAASPCLPEPRGPLSSALLDGLRSTTRIRHLPGSIAGIDMLDDDDGQLALHCCYELHYRSFRGVDSELEWAPELIEFRGLLERHFLDRLRDEGIDEESCSPAAARAALRELATADDGPSLSKYMLDQGALEEMREFCIHRSAYQLKEADPHTWVIPRLAGRAKAAALVIQYDEYGAGESAAMHSTLFAQTMQTLGLDARYGAYLDVLPGATLATGNLISLFGLHRRWRAACIGHLALFEMTSVEPMRRYSAALQRFGVSPRARRFYDVHVEADGWHQEVADADLVAGFLEVEPQHAATVVFGARALALVEGRMATAMLDAWRAGRSSLRADPHQGAGSSTESDAA